MTSWRKLSKHWDNFLRNNVMYTLLTSNNMQSRYFLHNVLGHYLTSHVRKYTKHVSWLTLAFSKLPLVRIMHDIPGCACTSQCQEQKLVVSILSENCDCTWLHFCTTPLSSAKYSLFIILATLLLSDIRFCLESGRLYICGRLYITCMWRYVHWTPSYYVWSLLLHYSTSMINTATKPEWS